MNRFVLLAITLLVLSAFGHAATPVKGEAPLVGEKDLNKARSDAAYPDEAKMRSALSVYGCVKMGTEKQPPDCKQNSAGYWFCTGVTNAWCEVTKEAADKAAIAKRLKESDDKAKREQADLGKRFNAIEDKEKHLEQIEKADLARRFKETEQKDKDRQAALAKRFDELEAIGDGKRGQPAKIASAPPKPPAGQPKPGATSVAEAFQKLDGGGPGLASPASPRAPGTFAALEALDKKQPRPSAGADMGASFEDADRRRKVAEAARQELELKQAARARLRDSAITDCTETKKAQEACEQACAREPEETLCTEKEERGSTCDGRSGGSTSRAVLCIPIFVCVASKPNPAFDVWKRCSTRGTAAVCYARNDPVKGIDACVQARMKE